MGAGGAPWETFPKVRTRSPLGWTLILVRQRVLSNRAEAPLGEAASSRVFPSAGGLLDSWCRMSTAHPVRLQMSAKVPMISDICWLEFSSEEWASFSASTTRTFRSEAWIQ